MATKIYESIEIELQDGTVITVKPLNLKNLRQVMTKWREVETKNTEDEFLDLLLECTSIAMKQFAPELSEKEKLEEALDLQSMYKILEVAADIKLNDPNLLMAAQELAGMS